MTPNATGHLFRKRFLVITLLADLVAAGMAMAQMSDVEWRQAREKMLSRKCEVIYNNDGNEPYLWPTNQPFSIAAFLDMRTTPVLGSQVDSVYYCPVSSGFGFLTAHIPSADLMLRDLGTVEHLAGKKNVLQKFLDVGTDPVREVVSWCRTNGFEVFVTLRVNDTHDQGTDQTKVEPPYAYPGNALFSPFKIRHPECLMGSYTNKPPSGNWSAVDFTHEAVRERFFQMCRDVCTHYDLDGLDLDFMRHIQLFKSVAWGGVASAEERAAMTATLRRIRAAAEEAGRARGRPILLSIRVPDSVPYCHDVGIDLQTWLKEGLVDRVVGTSYFQLNPWSYLVDLCRPYGVRVYASLDESRLPESSGLKRSSQETYRARAMAARRAGVDGVSYFNRFSVKEIRNLMWGSLEKMKLHDKRYFVSYRGARSSYSANALLKNGLRHETLRELSVKKPASLLPGASETYPIWIGDDMAALEREGVKPVCKLTVDATVPDGSTLLVEVNGHSAAFAQASGAYRRYDILSEWLVCGENQLRLLAGAGAGKRPLVIRDAALDVTFPK